MNVVVLDPLNGAPPEPDWFVELPGRSKSVQADRVKASAYWGTVVRELQSANKLAAANAHSIKRLVHAWIIWDRAAFQVARYGAIVPAPKTKTPMHNPWHAAMLQAGKMASMIETELSINPANRSKGGTVPKPPRPASPADQFLNKKDK